MTYQRYRESDFENRGKSSGYPPSPKPSFARRSPHRLARGRTVGASSSLWRTDTATSLPMALYRVNRDPRRSDKSEMVTLPLSEARRDLRSKYSRDNTKVSATGLLRARTIGDLDCTTAGSGFQCSR